MFGLGQRWTCGLVLTLVLFLLICFFMAQGCGRSGVHGDEEIGELIAGERLGP